MKMSAHFHRIIGFLLLSTCLFQLAIAQQVVTFKNKRGHKLVARIDVKNGTLWIMNADGSNKRQLTFNHGLTFYPF